MKNLTLEIKGELNINDLLKVLEIIVKPDVAIKILLPKDNVEDIKEIQDIATKEIFNRCIKEIANFLKFSDDIMKAYINIRNISTVDEFREYIIANGDYYSYTHRCSMLYIINKYCKLSIK